LFQERELMPQYPVTSYFWIVFREHSYQLASRTDKRGKETTLTGCEGIAYLG
jgi:hypothetical protein